MADKKGKALKINIIDIIVVLVIIFLVLGTAYKFLFMDKTSAVSSEVPISYTVLIKEVRQYSLDSIEVGDTLYDGSSGNAIGVISKIEKREATDAMADKDGVFYNVPIENRFDVTLTVDGKGSVSSEGYFINKTYELVVNSNKTFMTKYYECNGRVGEILN